MSEISDLLVERNVRRAVIVDDAYDETPLSADLASHEENWTQFFDDLNEVDRTRLRAIYPTYDEKTGGELRTADDFIAALWREQATLRPEIINPLLDPYKAAKTSDLAYLEVLTTGLRAAGLECEFAGRAFHAKAVVADLIVIDLFLGAAQDEQAIRASSAGLKGVMDARRDRPPLVLLMSRSPRLVARRAEFRDLSGCLEATFRIVSKLELAEAGRLVRLLHRLAAPYADALRLATFVNAWEEGLAKAGARTAKLIRMLDIADHAQIRQLLLNAEGQPLGSYLVDVFDRVLQHELEREAKIIDTAIEVNKLKDDEYPPPYVAGTPDLQVLAFRSIFEHPERLRLPQAEGSRVSFGDILRRKPVVAAEAPIPGAVPVARPPRRFDEVTSRGVLVVMTPACDLQRNEAKGILMLHGELSPLEASNWLYVDHPIRTPIIEFTPTERYWIRWNLKHIETVGHVDLTELLDAADGFTVVARLRDSQALELQQKLLSSLGRVGLLSPMPGTFAAKVEVYLPGPDRKLMRVEVPGMAPDCGVCFVGRGGEREMRLMFCENDCESICKAVAGFDPALIHSDARALGRSLGETGVMLKALEKGILLPSPNSQEFKPILVKGPPGAEGQPSADVPIGLVRRGETLQGTDIGSGHVKKAGIVLAVK
jgi:hypothetical protein